MSKQGRRGRGKRPRDDPPGLNLENVGQAPLTSLTTTIPGSSESPRESRRAREGISAASSLLHHDPALKITGEPPRPKMPIQPIWKTTGRDSSKIYKKGRTPHACENCRKAKSGCSGGQPCGRCKAADAVCVYGDGKRDKERKRLNKLSKDASILDQHNKDICDALLRIRLDMTMPQDQMRLAIDKVLEMKPRDLSIDDTEDSALVSQPTSPRPDDSSSDEDPEDDDESATNYDKTDLRDRTTETTQISSSSAWPIPREISTQYPTVPHDFDSGLALISYHTQDKDSVPYDTTNVEAFAWPDNSTADLLVYHYFEDVHPSAPLLDYPAFLDRYYSFPRGSTNVTQEDVIFLGTLNIVFATSAVWLNLRKTQYEHHYHDPLQYFARAKILCLDGGILYENATLSTTCALGVFCLYFITTSNLDRAFTFCALAIRHAIRQDLHLRSEAIKSPDQEHLVCLWWSLYSLECSLNGLTGRPSCVSVRDISTPLPFDVEVDPLFTSQGDSESLGNVLGSRSDSTHVSRASRGQPLSHLHMGQADSDPVHHSFMPSELVPSSIYFKFRIKFCLISHDISTRLYSAANPRSNWSDTQSLIHKIEQRLNDWYLSLPPEFLINFDTGNEPNWDNKNVLFGMGLEMELCYSRIILFRPYLCRFRERARNLSQSTLASNDNRAALCLEAAQHMIKILEAPARNVKTLYAVNPWWNILHYLCEALSVLLLEMAFQSQYDSTQSTYTLREAKKGMRWLSMMSEQSISARKAWEILDQMIRHVGPVFGWSEFNLPAEAPIPPGYRGTAAHVPEPTHHGQYESHGLEHATWPHGQHPGFGFDSTFGATFGNMSQGRGMVGNPLSYRTALEKFETMVKLHGQYDDPWKDLFQFLMAPPEMHEEPGSQVHLELPFDSRLGNFDSIGGRIHGDFS